MLSSYCSLHTTSHITLIDISDEWARPGTMRARFPFSGMNAMSRLHVCVDLSFDPSGRFMEIDLLAGCVFCFWSSWQEKCPVAPASTMAYCLVICIIDIEYAVSIYLLVLLLMIIVLQ